MESRESSFGVLTLATHDDYRKAIGLALSVRVSNPGVPIAVACATTVKPLLAPYFDHVVEEDSKLRGFVHKIHLDRYSPFDETFFFDSDVLVFRPLAEVVRRWRDQPYTACGNYSSTGLSSFGLDTENVLRIIQRKRLVHIDGAGHSFFRKPDCAAVFELARSIASNYENYAGKIRLADEDVMNIAMTLLDLKPVDHEEFWSRYLSGRRGTIDMDAATGRCVMQLVYNGKTQAPYMMHFAANEAPFAYAAQLRRLFKKFGVSTKGLLEKALADSYTREIKEPLKRAIRRFVKRKNHSRS